MAFSKTRAAGTKVTCISLITMHIARRAGANDTFPDRNRRELESVYSQTGVESSPVAVSDCTSCHSQPPLRVPVRIGCAKRILRRAYRRAIRASEGGETARRVGFQPARARESDCFGAGRLNKFRLLGCTLGWHLNPYRLNPYSLQPKPLRLVHILLQLGPLRFDQFAHGDSQVVATLVDLGVDLHDELVSLLLQLAPHDAFHRLA